jgi:hypothetical protein
MQEIIESYLNGNISFVRYYLQNSDHSMGELLEYFVNDSGYSPTMQEIVMFVKRLEQ